MAKTIPAVLITSTATSDDFLFSTKFLNKMSRMAVGASEYEIMYVAHNTPLPCKLLVPAEWINEIEAALQWKPEDED